MNPQEYSIEHIGIAVKNLEKAQAVYSTLFNREPYRLEEVASEHVRTLFYQNGQSKVELLEATNPSSPIARFIEKKGEGIHHIAFLVSDIKAELIRLHNAGFEILTPEPKRGADNKWVAFVHPKSCHGVLVEICQEIESPVE